MAKVLGTRHVLAVRDLESSREHFENVLGFEKDFSAPGWAFLSLGGFRVMLGECPDEIPAQDTGVHGYFAHVLVEDVDALYNTMKSAGATIYQDLETKPWGLREFYIVTPEGHRMGFAQTVSESPA